MKRVHVLLLSHVLLSTAATSAFAAAGVFVPVSRSTLIETKGGLAEVIVADPAIADVQAHGTSSLSVIGKKIGHTTIRLFNKEHKVIESYDITVGYDLPAIRRALKNFMPDETIAVEMVNTNVALTGQVSSPMAADKAVRIANEFLAEGGSAPPAPNASQGASMLGAAGGSGASMDIGKNKVINLLQVTSGQQVMLRVRVGEIRREALKRLGIDLSAVNLAGKGTIGFGTGAGVPAFFSALDSDVARTPGSFIITDPLTDTAPPQGILQGRLNIGGDSSIGGMIRALERDGLFKLLAEPNLVAVSGEQSEFLAGGEIPIPVPQGTGDTTRVTIEYKPFGVAVRFKPFVLSDNRLRMDVQPEVSELDYSNALNVSGFTVPALTTRRAKTVVEMAPGESFMIAGLIKDQTRSNIDQLPGVKELPILGALFRSTEFQRSETELVIAVTPYLVDPMKSTDVRLPTDNFAPASQMEMFFYGALGSLQGDASRISQTPPLEGPVGFMVE